MLRGTLENGGRRRSGAGPAMRALLVAALLGGWLLGAASGAAASQDDVPPAGPPLSLSQRLRAQGHAVDPAEAAYLDADEQVSDELLRLLAHAQMLFGIAPTTAGWQETMVMFLEPMVILDPARAPVPPPASLEAVHAQAVAYRTHLVAAALAWLDGVEANDPGWLQRGLEEYGAAERARLAWHKALWERYMGEPAPGP